jgi:two-component system, OmpR family, response regulator MprA
VHILVVDDDAELVSAIKRGLVYEGYTVEAEGTGEKALEKATAGKFDLIILDIMLPNLSGLEVCKRLRQISDVPILMLTAKGTTSDRVTGLDSGADDYLVKPFEFEELLARIRALTRRRPSTGGEVLNFADLSLNTITREVHRGGNLITLSSQEFDLMELFMHHPGQVLIKNAIYEHVWGYDFAGESNVLDVYVSYLRSKLEFGTRPRLIHTVRGVGYILKE